MPSPNAVGRWGTSGGNGHLWYCPCLREHPRYAESCHECHASRPPLPEPPAPGLPTPSPRFLTDAQVLGKEPIAGVDDAPLSDESDVVQEAVNALWRAGYKFLSRDLEAKCAALRSPRPVADAEALEAAYREGFEDGNVVDAPLASDGWRASETRRKALASRATPAGAPSDA